MYGLDPKIDVWFIEGRELIQVAVGRYQIQFAFDRDVAMSVEQKFEYRFQGELVTWEPGKMEAAGAVLKLVTATVTQARGTRDGTLTLEFDSGAILIVYDASNQCKSYTITRPGTTIVV
jgi:hypothetical protein